MRLLRKPGRGAAAKDFGKTNGHLRRDSPLPIHEFRKCSARNPERRRSLRDGQAHRFNTFTQSQGAGVGWIFHWHDHTSSMIVNIIKIKNFTVFKSES